MKLIFPFKNFSSNNILKFLEKKKLQDFILVKTGKYDETYHGHDFFFDNIKNFKDMLPNYENEILQIINTSNQETINAFFLN